MSTRFTIRELEKERSHTPTTDPMDENYKRIQYVRYADDFLIGVIGSKADCEKIKEEIRNFLFENLKLELSTEKTLITHAQSPAKFLGYDVYVRKCSLTKRNKKRQFSQKLRQSYCTCNYNRKNSCKTF